MGVIRKPANCVCLLNYRNKTLCRSLYIQFMLNYRCREGIKKVNIF